MDLMEIRPIRTEQAHRAALAEIDACWAAAEGTEEGGRLDVLLALVEIYASGRRYDRGNVRRFV